MITLTRKGKDRLRQLVEDCCDKRLTGLNYREHAWLDDIDENGHIEIASRYTIEHQPVTYRFCGDMVESC